MRVGPAPTPTVPGWHTGPRPREKTVRRALGWPGMAALTLLWLFMACCLATESEVSFESANKLYEQGRYAEAAAAYERLLAAGQVSAAVFFNLGNARFKLNEPGRAIAAYRQAERLAPRDPDVRANLQFVRRQVTGAESPTGARWQLWLQGLTPDEWAWGTAVAAGGFWLLLAAGQWRPAWRNRLRKLVGMLAAVTVLGTAATAWSVYSANLANAAVVVVAEAVARLGPLAESQSAFTLRDGAEVEIVDRKDDWLQVRQGRQLGWVQRDALEILHPPWAQRSTR